jgi:hypothetical protein
MSIALCKCGIDTCDHDEVDHEFDAAGTRYPCTAPVGGYLCPRPSYHDEKGVPCGPLTGEKLW